MQKHLSSRGNPSAFLFLCGKEWTGTDFFEKFFTLSKPSRTHAPYTYNEATTIAHGRFYELGRDDLGDYFEGISYFL